MEFIKSTLGVSVKTFPFARINSLPYYLTEDYRIESGLIGDCPVTFLFPIQPLKQLRTVEKHLDRIRKADASPVILVLESITRYKRDSLISAQIPFIVSGQQLYLPFLGTYLQENFSNKPKSSEFLQPSAQALLLYYIYRKADMLPIAEAIAPLGYSAMTISRAARQLTAVGLFEEQKNGVQKLIRPLFHGKELFDRALPYLSSPVKKEIYTFSSTPPALVCFAGITALAEHSMLNHEHPLCYASDSQQAITGTQDLVDSNQQCRVQIWKYSPHLFQSMLTSCSDRNTVDPLSLFLSLKDDPDERIEEALNCYLNDFWRDYNDDRN